MLQFSSFQKPLNKYLYIPFESFHPSSNKKAFIKGELMRYARNSSPFNSFYETREKLWKRLRAELGGIHSHFCFHCFVKSGAIIGDGDRKRAPFLVLGLAPWYGTILFLEQIAPSPAAHARTCCEDFYRCRAGKMASEIPEIFYTFGPLLNTFMSVGILLKYFCLKLLQFEWRKTVSNLGMSRFISQTRLCSAASFTRTSHYFTLNFIYV